MDSLNVRFGPNRLHDTASRICASPRSWRLKERKERKKGNAAECREQPRTIQPRTRAPRDRGFILKAAAGSRASRPLWLNERHRGGPIAVYFGGTGPETSGGPVALIGRWRVNNGRNLVHRTLGRGSRCRARLSAFHPR